MLDETGDISRSKRSWLRHATRSRTLLTRNPLRIGALVILSLLLAHTTSHAQARPTPRQISFPEIPPYFCSDYERRQWFLDNFATEWNEAAENAEDAAHYRAQASQRGNEHFQKGGDAPQQKRLDAEERWADQNYKDQVRVSDKTEAFRLRIFSTRVIDCSPRSLADYRDNLRNQVKAVDGQIQQAKAKIEAIEDEIRTELDKAGLLDAYDYGGGVLWGVEPTTVEHHNILNGVRAAHQSQEKLQRTVEKLEKHKAALQENFNRTSQFMDKHQQAGDPCTETEKSAQLRMTVSPASQQTPMGGAGSSSSARPPEPKSVSGRGFQPFSLRGEFKFTKESPSTDSPRLPTGLTEGGAAFLWMAFGFDPYVIASWSGVQTIPPAVSLDRGLSSPTQESILKYAQTSDPITPPDPRLEQWSALWRKAEALDKAGNFQEARLLRQQAEELFWTDEDTQPPAIAPLNDDGTFRLDELQLKFGASYRLDVRYKNQGASFNLGRSLSNPAPQTAVEKKYDAKSETANRVILAWPSSRDAIQAGRAAPGRAFDTSLFSAFTKDRVNVLTSQVLNGKCRQFLDSAGTLYSDSDYDRNVAPAPSLDPAHWPVATPEPLFFSLSAEE